MGILKDIDDIQKAVDEKFSHPYDEDLLTRKTHPGRHKMAFFIMCREFVFNYMRETTYNPDKNFDDEKMKLFYDDLCLAYRSISEHFSFDEQRKSYIFNREKPYQLK